MFFLLLSAKKYKARFLTSFNDFADDTVPYMYHCHMLTHEDQCMMGQFVVSSIVGIQTAEEFSSFSVFADLILW